MTNKAYFYSCRKMCNAPDKNDANSFNWTIYNNQRCLDELFGSKNQTKTRPSRLYIIQESI